MRKIVTGSAAAVLFAGIAAIATAVPAAADNPTLLGVSKNWGAYTVGNGPDKVCYALSQPRSTAPKKAKRDPIFFLINDWPGRRARAEPEVVPGYKYKDGSPVTAEVSGNKYTFFTKNDGDAGSAWVKEVIDEQHLIDNMQRGDELVITGTSARGTLTRDTYSLDGLSDALTKIHTACNM
jgi:hypothetical protein